MSEDTTQPTLEDDDPSVTEVPEAPKRPPMFSEELSAVAMSLFPEGSPIFLVNAADGSMFYKSVHEQRFGVEHDFEHFEVAQTAFTRATGNFERLIPMLKRVGFSMTPFHILLDESSPALRERSREFLTSFPLCGYGDESRKQIVVMQATNAVVEPMIRDASDSAWYAMSAITVSNGDNSRTFVTYRHVKAFPTAEEGRLPTEVAQIPAMKVDLKEQANLVPALLQTHLASFGLSAVAAAVSRYSYSDKPKDAGEILNATHREFGRRYVKEDKDPTIRLYSKTKMGVQLTRWQQMAIEIDGATTVIENLRDQDVAYFSSNVGDWIVTELLMREGIITIDVKLLPLIERALDLAYLVSTPTLPMNITMRLGWLMDEPKVECKLDDPERGFTAGYFYAITSRAQESWERCDTEEEDPKTGKVIWKRKRRPKKWQQFRITNDHDKAVEFDDDSPEDISFLAEHFVIRDPGHQATRFPGSTFAMLDAVRRVEEKFLVPRGHSLKTFQRYDLAVMLAKKDAVLAHEMGLGKTLEILTYITVCVLELGADPAGLIVTRKDLIPQWCAEAEKFYGYKLKVLDGTAPVALSGQDRKNWQISEYARVRALKQKIRNGEEKGIWITSYYDLAQTMKRASDQHNPFFHSRYRYYDDSTKQEEWGWKQSNGTCPNCGHYWNFQSQSVCLNKVLHDNDIPGKFAESQTVCGWTHHQIRFKTYGSLLSTTFKRGVICLDEATEISGIDSQMSAAVCGLRAAYRLAATGTPVKNYIGQAFNILGWTLGFTSQRKKSRNKRKAQEGAVVKAIRWPYQYGIEGKRDFEEKYAAYEQQQNSDGAWAGKKPIAATLQNSRLWRETAPIIVSRRKEETGVRLPPKKFHTIQAPLGVYQREQMNFWRINYSRWKEEQDQKLVAAGQAEAVYEGWGNSGGMNKSILGLEAKLNWACVLPEGDDAHQWTNVPVSNLTPAMFKSIETTMKLVAAGKKVVVGSDTPKAIEFISECLEARGVKTVCLSKGGQSLSPKERPDLIVEFQNGTAQVLCASMRSIEMGHNIDSASAMVIHGLTWDYKTFHQFENRIHRLTSKNPIDIFVVLPGEERHTLTGRKWAVLKDKTAGVAKALHGEFDLIEDEKVDTQAIIADLLKEGIPMTGEEVSEVKVQEGFAKMAHISAYERDLVFEKSLATWDDLEEPQEGDLVFNPKAYVSDKPGEEFISHGEVADALEAFFRPWVLETAQEEHERNSKLYQLQIALQARFIEVDIDVSLLVMDALEISWQMPLDQASDLIEELLVSVGVDVSKMLRPAATPEPEPEPAPEPVVGTATHQADEPEVDEPSGTEEDVEPPVVTATAPAIDFVGQIRGLKELYDEGILTEEEFSEAKAALLVQMRSQVASEGVTA